MHGSGEGFFRVPNVKDPDISAAQVKTGLSMEACRQLCLHSVCKSGCVGGSRGLHELEAI